MYNPRTHTHTIKPSGLQLGELRQGFLLSLFLCLALSSPPLLSLPSLVNSPTWPGLPIQKLWWGSVSYLFGQAQMDLWIERVYEREREKSWRREGEWPPWHVMILRNNLPPSSSSLPSFLLSLSQVSLSILNSVSRPLSPEHRLCQCRLAADYRCNHSHFRWSDRRKGLQIILTPPLNSFSWRRWPTTTTLFLSSIFSRPENSLRKAQLKQCLGKPILPISAAYFSVM